MGWCAAVVLALGVLGSHGAQAAASHKLAPTHTSPAVHRASLDTGHTFHLEQRGIASWYGPHFVGRTTASGERFNPWAMTCANKSLPLGSVVRVVNRANGRAVTLRVNDRGPYVRGRILDVSEGAAVRLGFRKQGITHVKVIVLAREDHRAGT